jgi:hypothetical protein
LGGFSHRVLERKRGVSSRARRDTERRSLGLWLEHGFDVPRVLDEPLPAWLDGRPALWLEYTPGPRLFELLHEGRLGPDQGPALVERLGAEHQRRHALALELSQPLLLQEHPTVKHVLVCAERLVTIDMEHGYLPGYPLEVAIGYEVASTMRSLWLDPERPLNEGFGAAFLAGYQDPALLRRACAAYLAASMGGWFRRRSDRRRRGQRSKTAVAEQVQALVL